MKMLYKGMKKFKKNLGSEKLISKGMKLLYKGMKKFKFFLWSEKVVSQGMKLLYQGMKKFIREQHVCWHDLKRLASMGVFMFMSLNMSAGSW
jgi:hypothetical protein